MCPIVKPPVKLMKRSRKPLKCLYHNKIQRNSVTYGGYLLRLIVGTFLWLVFQIACPIAVFYAFMLMKILLITLFLLKLNYFPWNFFFIMLSFLFLTNSIANTLDTCVLTYETLVSEANIWGYMICYMQCKKNYTFILLLVSEM